MATVDWQDPDEHTRRRARRQASARARTRRRRLALAGAAALAATVAAVLLALTAGGGRTRPATAPASKSASAASATGAAPAQPAAGAGGAQLAAVRRLASYGLPVYCAGSRGRMVALTFDDGPGPYTSLAIRKLRKHHVPATFFIVGRNVDRFPAGLLSLESRYEAVGDHSFTHPFLPALAPALVASELGRTQQLLQRRTDRPVVLFRPPYGGRTPAIDAEVRRLGMLQVVWSVDSRDSEGADYAQIAANVNAGLRPGAIILMHENRGQTIRALLQIFPALERKHLQPVTLPELLAADPPSLSQLRAGGRGCGGVAVSRLSG